MANIYEIIVFGVVLGGAVFHILIESLNLSCASAAVAPEFEGFYDNERYRIAQNYLRENTWFDLIQTGLMAPLTMGFIQIGGFQALDRAARGLTMRTLGVPAEHPIVTGIFFMALVSVLSGFFSIGFSVYRTFVIEEKYGFNKTSAKTFVLDLLKGIFLGIVLGMPILSLVLWFFQSTGDYAWIWSWLGICGIQILLHFLAPAVILPLFNKFSPLQDSPLKAAIEEYARGQDFQLGGIFTMDGSQRSSKANAFFTGFGKFRRIVLFDTLIQKHSTEELVAILAHEIGHFKKKHIAKQMLLSFLSSGIMFFLLAKMNQNRGLFDAFKMEYVSIYASLVFFGLIYSPVSQIVSLAGLAMSRANEFEADEYAAKTYGNPAVLATALKKLSVDNLSNLTPHPWKVLTEYTHPPVLQRVRRLQKISR